MTRMTAYWLCLTVAAAALQNAPADPAWSVRAWQSDAGLPDNSVVGIDQTPDSFLWVATKTGLARFDGVQFREVPVLAEGLQAGVLKALAADRHGRLWVAIGRRTVVCLDPGRPVAVFNLERGRPDAGTGNMVMDGEGAVWVSYLSNTAGGEVFRIQDGQVRLFTAEDGLPDGGNCELAVAAEGRLWFCRGARVGVFRDGRFRLLEPSGVQRITAVRSGGVWG
ncbi:MAG: hypothetical protein WCK89_06095, partial [bacterium]